MTLLPAPRRFVPFLAAFAAVALLSLLGAARAFAQAPGAPRANDGFDCVPASDGSGAFTCRPRASDPDLRPSLVQSQLRAPVVTEIERNYFVEFLGGVLGEVVAFVPAVGVAAIAESGNPDYGGDPDVWNGLSAAPVAGVLGYLAFSPFTIAAGVTLFSKADLRYDEALLGATLGTLPGAALMGLGLAMLDEGNLEGGIFPVLFSLPTLLIAPIVSVAVADPSDPLPDERVAAAPRVLPTASMTADGTGGLLGLTGRY